MSGGLSETCANNILNAFRHIAFDITAVYVQLHTGDPGVDGEDNISVGDPSLKAVTFSAAATGAIAISTSPLWTNADTSETLTDFSVWNGPDGPGTDDPLWANPLTTPQSWADTDTYTLDELGLTLTPLMADD